MRHLLNGLLTAAVSGGAAATGSILIDPEHFGAAHLQHLGIVFGAGAVLGILNWLRSSPWDIQITEQPGIDPARFSKPLGALLLALLPFHLACASAAPAGATQLTPEQHRRLLVIDVTRDVVTTVKAANQAQQLADRPTGIVLHACDAILQATIERPSGYADLARRALQLARDALDADEQAKAARFLDRLARALDGISNASDWGSSRP